MSWEKKAGIITLIFGIGIFAISILLHLHHSWGLVPPPANMAIGAAVILAGLGLLLNRKR